MTKETILKRLLIEDKITLEELLILADNKYKEPTVYGPLKKTRTAKEILDEWQMKDKRTNPYQWDPLHNKEPLQWYQQQLTCDTNLVNHDASPYLGPNAKIKYTN